MKREGQATQQFGGNWTEEKLNIFTGYLTAYLTALQNQKFGKIYIDAFAGTGEIVTRDGEQHLVGSAKRALSAVLAFDHYYFIEQDKKKVSKLRTVVDTGFSQLSGPAPENCTKRRVSLDGTIEQSSWEHEQADV